MERIFKNNQYFINKEGEVYRQNKKDNKFKLLKTKLDKGYYRICLYIDKKPTMFSVHRLLGIVFIPNPENKPCIDHIDRNTKNNDLSNLRWATYKENVDNRELKSKSNYFYIYKTNANTYKVMKSIKGTKKIEFSKTFKILEDAESFIASY